MANAQSKPLYALIVAVMMSDLAGCSAISKPRPSAADSATVKAATDSLIASGSEMVVPVIDDVDNGRLLCAVPLHQGLTVRELVASAPPVKAICNKRIILVARRGDGGWALNPAGPESPNYDMKLLPFDKVRLVSAEPPPRIAEEPTE